MIEHPSLLHSGGGSNPALRKRLIKGLTKSRASDFMKEALPGIFRIERVWFAHQPQFLTASFNIGFSRRLIKNLYSHTLIEGYRHRDEVRKSIIDNPIDQHSRTPPIILCAPS
ncbi:MAG: hypothetical protein M2R46_04365 [Verrucomicrobia subdivision 3 bacterium]|nr:hypothetical protein [Limisphaerales bacterium]